MNYWLICLPRPDLEHCMKVGVFGLSRKHIIGNVRQGDKIVCCAGKGDWKIIGTGEVASDYYVDLEDVFLKPGVYPDRFRFRATKSKKEADLIQIIDELSFVTNPAFWAVYFRSGIAKLTKDDFDLINSKLGPVTSPTN